MGVLSNQQQTMEMERLGMLSGVGAQQRGLAQQGLDIGYQDYLTQQGYGMEQINWLSNILQGNAMQPGSTSTIFGQQPTGLQQGIGSLIAGLGTFQMGRGG